MAEALEAFFNVIEGFLLFWVSAEGVNKSFPAKASDWVLAFSVNLEIQILQMPAAPRNFLEFLSHGWDWMEQMTSFFVRGGPRAWCP